MTRIIMEMDDGDTVAAETPVPAEMFRDALDGTTKLYYYGRPVKALTVFA